MKLVLILLIVFYHQNEMISGSIIDYFAGKIKEVLVDLSNSFKTFRLGIQRFFERKQNRKPMEEITEETTPFNNVIVRRIYSQIELLNKKRFTTVPPLHAIIKEIHKPVKAVINTMSFNQSAINQTTVYGRQFESHGVQTQDGYLLVLHRMLAPSNITTNKTVLLHHGLLGSSADWLLLEANDCLPYILTTAGYDVWMSNARGNYYSRKHMSLNVSTLEYWNFTFHEIGMYDIPATIDYIKKTKNYTTETINFIGHSMGATALLVTLSMKPEYNQHLRMGVLLAPLAYMSHTNGPFKIISPITDVLKPQLFEVLGENGEFLPNRRVPDWLANKCLGPKIFCRNPLLFLCGGIPQLTTRDPNFVAKILYHVPAGGSTKTILHYMQLNKTGKFHPYDNATFKYPLNKVHLSIAMISSNDDWFSNTSDVMKLYQSIANPVDHYHIHNKNISHPDFIWGVNANTVIYSKVLDFLEKGLSIDASKRNEIL